MIKIQNLTKIFGSKEKLAAKHLKSDSLSKAELNKRYGCTLALNNISLEIPEGSISVIMGLSGCGKSTLVRTLNRLVEPTLGNIWLNEKNICKLKRKQLQLLRRFEMSMVFQHFGLFPHRTVKENVEFGLKMQKVNYKDCSVKAQKWIDSVGLKGTENDYPAELSGGMQQRVGLARALATNSPIILMDEAFSALDPLIRAQLQDQLLVLQSELKKTIIFITHDLKEGIKLGSQIAILKEGKLIQAGTPQEILQNPADEYVRDFVKHTK